MLSKASIKSLPFIPPPRKHRHRYFGVLAPYSPWRATVVVQAGRKLGAGSKGPWPKTVRTDFDPTRTVHSARYFLAQLLALIYGVFALKRSGCVGRVRLDGFITEPATVRQILEHVGEPTSAPEIAPARSRPLEMKIAHPWLIRKRSLRQSLNLSLPRRQTRERKPVMIGCCTMRVSMHS